MECPWRGGPEPTNGQQSARVAESWRCGSRHGTSAKRMDSGRKLLGKSRPVGIPESFKWRGHFNVTIVGSTQVEPMFFWSSYNAFEASRPCSSLPHMLTSKTQGSILQGPTRWMLQFGCMQRDPLVENGHVRLQYWEVRWSVKKSDAQAGKRAPKTLCRISLDPSSTIAKAAVSPHNSADLLAVKRDKGS